MGRARSPSCRARERGPPRCGRCCRDRSRRACGCRARCPVNFFFSHFPAFIEAVACGMCRASETSSAMACSAVVTCCRRACSSPRCRASSRRPRRRCRRPIPARPTTLSFFRGVDHCGGHLGAAANHQRVGIRDGLIEVTRRQARLENSPTVSPGERSRISRPWLARESLTRTLATMVFLPIGVCAPFPPDPLSDLRCRAGRRAARRTADPPVRYRAARDRAEWDTARLRLVTPWTGSRKTSAGREL